MLGFYPACRKFLQNIENRHAKALKYDTVLSKRMTL